LQSSLKFSRPLLFCVWAGPENFNCLDKRFSDYSWSYISNTAVSHAIEDGLLNRNNYDATHYLSSIDEKGINIQLGKSCTEKFYE